MAREVLANGATIRIVVAMPHHAVLALLRETAASNRVLR